MNTLDPSALIKINEHRSHELSRFWTNRMYHDKYMKFSDETEVNRILSRVYDYYTKFLPSYMKELEKYSIIDNTIDTSMETAPIETRRMDIKLGMIRSIYESNNYTKKDKNKLIDNFVRYELAPRYSITDKSDITKLKKLLTNSFKNDTISIRYLDYLVRREIRKE